MNQLKNYRIKITVATPVFIGSGLSYQKNEYFYDRDTRKIHIINPEILMRWIVEKGRIQNFERFSLSGASLSKFFEDLRVRPESIPGLIEYSADAGAAVEQGRLIEIKAFIKDTANRPYIPGSSLKGALRTVILTKMLRDAGREEFLDNERIAKKNPAAQIEIKHLHTLDRAGEKANALNSVMSALSISDSAPLAQPSLTLCRKIDVSKGGYEGRLNIARECLRPGTEAEFILTLKPESGKIDAGYIKKAVEEFGGYYSRTYADKFSLPQGAVKEDFSNCILLGGGCGYFGKNILYPGRDYESALRLAAALMAKKYAKHKHEGDVETGVSPHTLKYTEYIEPNGRGSVKCQMGICRVDIEERA